MATLRKRIGKWTVEIRRKGHRNVYGTFVHKSDARSFVHKVESEITQNKYKDISEAATTTFKVALHRYIREKIENKTDKQTEVAETSPSTVRIVQQKDPDMKQGIGAI